MLALISLPTPTLLAVPFSVTECLLELVAFDVFVVVTFVLVVVVVVVDVVLVGLVLGVVVGSFQ